jgi:hypothetical protein
MTALAKNTVSRSDQRARRSAQEAKYAPRATVAIRPSPAPVEDIRLRRLTAQTLDALKRPDAVPSRILMAAFEQAKAFGASK